MRRNRAALLGLILFFFFTCSIPAQVVSPLEIKDPEMRALQQQNMDDLKLAGRDILAIKFDYPFYLSRKLDLDQLQQQHADQQSIRFDTYSGKSVIAVTGNYYAAYSTNKMTAEQRARSTFLNVVQPIVQAVAPHFQRNQHVQGYAVEISHHILGKTMGVSMERPENLMVFLPQAAAMKLLASKDDEVRQAALMQGQTFLNAEPINIWLNGIEPKVAATSPPQDSNSPASPQSKIIRNTDGDIQNSGATSDSVSSPKSAETSTKPKEVVAPVGRDTSPNALSSLQSANQQVLDQLVKEQDALVHFVAYAPPKFIAFRQETYLELSLTSTLPGSAAGSRYKLAAMAFDDHIAHLIRPLLNYFRTEQQFDGIGFSTTIHLAVKTGAANTSEAVEFFLPLAFLRCYEKYDCTGQQLLDAGTVLINGERVALNLQVAEGGSAN
jgi:hypothetical protein